MQLHEELLQIADRLTTLAARGFTPEITEPIRSLNEAVDQIDKAFSGSWLGYHANVYYDGLKPQIKTAIIKNQLKHNPLTRWPRALAWASSNMGLTSREIAPAWG